MPISNQILLIYLNILFYKYFNIFYFRLVVELSLARLKCKAKVYAFADALEGFFWA
jgi:hypothetical protein